MLAATRARAFGRAARLPEKVVEPTRSRFVPFARYVLERELGLSNKLPHVRRGLRSQPVRFPKNDSTCHGVILTPHHSVQFDKNAPMLIRPIRANPHRKKLLDRCSFVAVLCVLLFPFPLPAPGVMGGLPFRRGALASVAQSAHVRARRRARHASVPGSRSRRAPWRSALPVV